MRISDWSSDVCSSDLPVPRPTRGRRAAPRDSLRPAGSPSSPARDPRGPRPAAPEARRGARSEEHTSELQSLMRISYAVFCLKKKTDINNRKQEINTGNRKEIENVNISTKGNKN